MQRSERNKKSKNFDHLEGRLDTCNFFVITEFKVILNNMVFIFFDFILILALLDLGQIPCNDELSGRCDDGILLLAFNLIEPARG